MLLKAGTNLKLWDVEHTDWLGKVCDDMRLAQVRAELAVAEPVGAHGNAAA